MLIYVKLYAIRYTLYAPRFALATIRYTLYTIRYTSYAIRYTLYAMRHALYAIRYTPRTTSGTNRSKNKLWDKSFQKQTLGQIVPKNKKKRPNKFSPSSPLKKKGPGVFPAERLNLVVTMRPAPCGPRGVQIHLLASHQMLSIAMSALL